MASVGTGGPLDSIAESKDGSNVYDDHRAVMTDTGMLEVLQSQVDAIAPIEIPRIVEALRDVSSPKILDVGCGSGVFFFELAKALPDATMLGIDLEEKLVEVSQTRASQLEMSDRCTFRVMDACTLAGLEDDMFDLVLNRHQIHILTEDQRAQCFDAMLRVAKPGGAGVHILAEDYGMLFFAGTRPERNPADFWHAVRVFGEKAGGDWMVGRSVLWEVMSAARNGLPTASGTSSSGTASEDQDGTPKDRKPEGAAAAGRVGSGLERLDLAASTEELIKLDSIDASGKLDLGLCRILKSWQASYCGIVGSTTGMGAAKVSEYFDEMIRVTSDTAAGRGQWHIPRICLKKASK